MRKHDEGYALPFVLVVFLVFSLIATSVLTVSLNNLKKQKASIQRTQDQYAAQGEIEKACASIANKDDCFSGTVTKDTVQSALAGITGVECSEATVAGDTVTVTLSATSGNLTINCKVEIKKANGGTFEAVYKTYTITNGGGG